jgi:hypothetical protein
MCGTALEAGGWGFCAGNDWGWAGDGLVSPQGVQDVPGLCGETVGWGLGVGDWRCAGKLVGSGSGMVGLVCARKLRPAHSASGREIRRRVDSQEVKEN